MTCESFGMRWPATSVSASARRFAFGVVGRRRSVSWITRCAKSVSDATRSSSAAASGRSKIASSAFTRVCALVCVPPWRYVATSRTTRLSSASSSDASSRCSSSTVRMSCGSASSSIAPRWYLATSGARCSHAGRTNFRSNSSYAARTSARTASGSFASRIAAPWENASTSRTSVRRSSSDDASYSIPERRAARTTDSISPIGKRSTWSLSMRRSSRSFITFGKSSRS